MDEILTHELSPVPLSLAKINGDMNSTSKSDMLTILTNDLGIEVLHSLPLPTPQHRTCMLFDGHALIQSLGKPSQCNSFNDYAEVFFKKVSSCLQDDIKQVHVIFDTYQQQSIKASTRSKRTTKKRPIRRVINRGDMPLPQVWDQFIAMNENKADLAHFLTQYMLAQGENLPADCELIIAGGFRDPQKAVNYKG